MVLTQITNLHANGGLKRVENETLGIYQIGNLDTRRINVGANIKRVRVQQRPKRILLILIFILQKRETRLRNGFLFSTSVC